MQSNLYTGEADNRLYLERPQIDKLLERASKNHVVTVTAGAGYGKTRAVFNYVRRSGERVSWMQISQRDNSGEQFWEDFTQAIGLSSRDTAEAMRELGFPDTDRQFEEFLKLPARKHLDKTRHIIVLDDLYLLSSGEVLDFLQRFVNAIFPNVTFIMISRTTPSIKIIPGKRNQEIGRITEEDLRFSKTEMLNYYHLQDLNPDSGTIESIYKDTNGWAFAIYLAGRTLKNLREGQSYVSRQMEENLSKMIEEEIASALSPELRRFLIKLSLIENYQKDLVELLAESSSLMGELESLGSFISLGVHSNTYHINELILNYFARFQGELSGEEQRDIWEKSAAWCLSRKLEISAIRYYEKAGDYPGIIHTITTLPMSIPLRTAQVLLDTIDKAPQEYFEKNPTAYAVRPRLLYMLGKLDEAEQELWKIINWMLENGYGELEGDAARLLMACYNNLGYIDMITCIFSRDYKFPDYFKKAREYSDRCGFRVGPPLSVTTVCSYCGRVSVPDKGAIENYIAAVRRAIPDISVSLSGCMMGMDTLCEAELAYYQGDLTKAVTLLRKSMDEARAGNQFEILSRACSLLMQSALAMGDGATVREALTSREALLQEPMYVDRYVHHDIFLGWLYINTGRIEQIAGWLKNDLEESGLNPVNYGNEILIKAAYHLNRREYPQTLAVLWGSKAPYGPSAFIYGQLDILSGESICRYKMGDHRGAFAALDRACALAEPNGLWMPFYQQGKNMRTLTEAALETSNPKKKKSSPGAYVVRTDSKILEKIRSGAANYAKHRLALEREFNPQKNKPTTELSRDLSSRESRVLTALFQGLTVEEIALEIQLSTNTVKSIIKSVYAKLGALNKADAIRIAVKQGILG